METRVSRVQILPGPFIMKDFEEWVRKLKKSKKAIIVEGKKDKLALEELGVKKDIIILNKPLFQVVETIASKYKDCILLLDLDKEGRKLHHKLKHDLQKHKVRIDNKFREFLLKEKKIKQIESLKKI